MAKLVVSTGAVASWTNHSSLIATTGEEASFTLSTNAPQLTTTAMASGGVLATSSLSDLYQSTVALAGRMNPALIGSAMALTWGEYSTNIKSAVFNLNWPAIDVTCVDATDAYEYLPGLLDWSVAITAVMDDTDDIPLAKGAAGALGVTVTDSSSDTHIIGGNVTVQDVSTGEVTPGASPLVTITAKGTGNLSGGAGYSTSTADPQLLDDLADGSNNIINPGAGTLTMQSATSRTYIVDAFLSNLTLSLGVGQVVGWTATAQGTGAITGTAIS